MQIFPPLLFLVPLLVGLGVNLISPRGFIGADIGFPIAAGLLIAGSVLASAAVQALRKAGTTAYPAQTATALVTDGPYRYSRNPMYIALAISYLSIAFAANSLSAVLLLPIALLGVQKLAIEPEEHYLETAFPQPYAAYKTRVRRWF